MGFIYRSAFIIGITLLVPVIIKYLTAKSKEDDTVVYTVKMRGNMMKVLTIMTMICTPLGVMAAVAFFSYLPLKDWENMCYTAVVIFVSIADFCMWKHYKENKIVVLNDKKIKVIKGRKSDTLSRNRITYRKINSSKIHLYYKDKKMFTVTRQFDNFENLERWLKNSESEESHITQ
ncbi:hypothetical protein [Parablautia sp. Marseille-Q6255]|uniref:hypothetical protein n=1 Tax=Parablautia sp. Marseille-Q6255 TaxID=3039593 RepID=UPI0024BC2112|nr:hypothetical protein [Parablautia sp. Marseille-Q6255]